MTKENIFEANTNWYELWMKQSRDFFDSAQKNLKDIFSQDSLVNPEEHLNQINQWLETLKRQWEFSQLTEEQKAYQIYWNAIAKLCNEASELMMNQWIKRTHEDNPIKSVRELYALWLDCCHEVYQRALRSQEYQANYGELMNAAFKFWQSALSK